MVHAGSTKSTAWPSKWSNATWAAWPWRASPIRASRYVGHSMPKPQADRTTTTMKAGALGSTWTPKPWRRWGSHPRTNPPGFRWQEPPSTALGAEYGGPRKSTEDSGRNYFANLLLWEDTSQSAQRVYSGSSHPLRPPRPLAVLITMIRNNEREHAPAKLSLQSLDTFLRAAVL